MYISKSSYSWTQSSRNKLFHSWDMVSVWSSLLLGPCLWSWGHALEKKQQFCPRRDLGPNTAALICVPKEKNAQDRCSLESGMMERETDLEEACSVVWIWLECVAKVHVQEVSSPCGDTEVWLSAWEHQPQNVGPQDAEML